MRCHRSPSLWYENTSWYGCRSSTKGPGSKALPVFSCHIWNLASISWLKTAAADPAIIFTFLVIGRRQKKPSSYPQGHFIEVSHHFEHPNKKNLIMWSYLAARDWGKCKHLATWTANTIMVKDSGIDSWK